jgi:hypothetical protein
MQTRADALVPVAVLVLMLVLVLVPVPMRHLLLLRKHKPVVSGG